MSFNEKLQKLRKANGLSQEGLADLLDVTRQSVSKWESGTTYPEMDKLLAMCKIFKCSLDDLTNDDITEIKTDDKKKNSLYSMIDSILYFINETYQTCKVMTRNELAGLIVRMGIVAIILSLFYMPFDIIQNIFAKTLYSIHNEFIINIGISMIELLINCAYFALFAIIFIYVFQMLYLKNESYKMRRITQKVEKVQINDSVEKKSISSTETVPVKEKEHKIEAASATLFHFLGAIVVFVGKSIACLLSIPILILLFLLCAILFICLFLLFKGVLYVSILIGIPFAILLLLVVLEVFFCFILNRKANEKRISILFLMSIIGLGSSFGILLLDISSISYVNEVPKQVKMDTLIEEYEMTKDMYFLFQDSVEYIVDNKLENKVQIEVNYYKDYTEVLLPPNVHSSVAYHEKPYVFINQHLISIIIDDLSHKKLYNYGYLNEVTMKIYTSEKNIQILKENYQQEIERMNQDIEEQNYYLNVIEEYENTIQIIKKEKEELQNNNDNLETKIIELQNKIEEYKNKIDDYKSKLQAMIEN